MEYYDFELTDNFDLSLDDETNGRSICLNTLLRKKRIDFDNNSLDINEKGLSVGDVLTDQDKQTGSLVWLDLLQQNSNNIIPYIKNEINFRFNNLIKRKIIDSFSIQSVGIKEETLSINLMIGNELLENIIVS